MTTYTLEHGAAGPGDFLTALTEFGGTLDSGSSAGSVTVKVAPVDGQAPVVPSEVTAAPVTPKATGTDHYGVDTVSRDGVHVVQAVYRHRVDTADGSAVLRHRITVPAGGERAAVAGLAVAALDATGIDAGAGHVLIEGNSEGLRATGVLDSPPHWAVPADLSFHAYGHSQQHLLAESLLQPEAFARRVKRAPRDRGSVLALAYLRGGDQDAITNPYVSQLVRHLPGFAGLVRAPGTAGTPMEGVWGYVAFVHTDEPLVRQSLTILHELADSGQLWHGDRIYIDFNGRIS